MPEPGRVPPSPRLRSGRVVAVLRAPDAAAYRPVVDLLVEHEITCIELTLSTPGTLAALPGLVERFAERADIGVGTALTAKDAETAFQGGSAFLVTPAVLPEVMRAATRRARPVYPGGLSPSEVLTNWREGASAVKVFPAGPMGPTYLKALRGPFPEVALLPSGGVRVDDIPAWLDAGAMAVSLGSELVGDALHGGSLSELAARVRRVRALLDGEIEKSRL